MTSWALTVALSSASFLYLTCLARAAARPRPRRLTGHGLHALMCTAMVVTVWVAVPPPVIRGLAGLFAAITAWLLWQAAKRKRSVRRWYDAVMAAAMTWMTNAEHMAHRGHAATGHSGAAYQVLAVAFLLGAAWLAAQASQPRHGCRGHAMAGCLMSAGMALAFAQMAASAG